MEPNPSVGAQTLGNTSVTRPHNGAKTVFPELDKRKRGTRNGRRGVQGI